MPGSIFGTIRPGFFVFIVILILAGWLQACRQTDKKRSGPQKAQAEEVMVKNFGKAIFSMDPWSIEKNMDSLVTDYAFFIGESPDSVSINQLRDFITDPFNRELAAKCEEKYPDTDFLKSELSEVFTLCEKQFQGFQFPEVYLYVSGLLYEYPVQYVDSVLLIALDMFLGWDYVPYRAAGIPVYITRRMESQDIVPECCRQIAYSKIPETFTPKILLDHMLLHGKVLYAMDVMLPGVPDQLKIGYTQDQLNWCRQNERLLWRLFIDQEVLFRTDANPKARFISDGPFTAGLPDGAPAMLGRWTGWQIVRSFMKKNSGTSLSDLFQIEDSQQILTKSGYKPKK